MDQWGPYVPERTWYPGATADESASYEEACAADKPLDGIFGFCNTSGSINASFALWNGADSHLKERLFDQREKYTHGILDPQYRYFSCRYVYPQTKFCYDPLENHPSSDQVFDVHFELAKEHPTRLHYQLTITNREAISPDAEASKTRAALTVVAKLGVCHPTCGSIKKVQSSACLRVSATCDCGLACMQANPIGHKPPTVTLNYRLHYHTDGLESVVFSDDSPGALNRLIVHEDRTGLLPDSKGSRAGIVYRLMVPPQGSVTLRFILTEELVSLSDTEPPAEAFSGSAVEELMHRSAQLASDSLTACFDKDGIPDAIQRVCQRAYSSILWNRQLCKVKTPLASNFCCLSVVPDKWHKPRVVTWEHALHALVLCRISRQLATAELRCQLARMLIGGEMLGVKASPPIMPLVLLNLVECYNDKEEADFLFIGLLRHLSWWLIDWVDHDGRCTIDGGILGLQQIGWVAIPHNRESNDSLVWSGFFCAKMVKLAALLQRRELKTLIDLFNAVVSTLYQDHAFADGLFRPKLVGRQGVYCDTGAPYRGVCSCAYGFVPLLGCACLPWDLLIDDESRILIQWLNWLSSAANANETPMLFVKTNSAGNQFLISCISEQDFLKVCATLFDPEHFLCAFGIRCTSRLLGEKFKDEPGCSAYQAAHFDVLSVPLNYLTLEALKCWELIYGQLLQLEYPTGSGMRLSLNEIIVDISQRLMKLFKDADGPMFYEFYRADNGKGVEPTASWSCLIANIALNLNLKPTPAVHVPPSMPRAVGRIAPKATVVQAFRAFLRSSIKLDQFAPDANFDWDSDE